MMLSQIYDALTKIPNISEHLYYDEIWHRIMIDRSIFNLPGIRPLDEHIITEFRYIIEQNGIDTDHEDTKRAMVKFALHNRRNPFIERIRSVVWDNKPRMDDFIRSMDGRTNLNEKDNNTYITWVSRAIFLSVIGRQLENGTLVDIIPVIVGRQGDGKSTLCRKLALGWYSPNQEKANDERKFYEKSDGSIICELQEGTQFDEYAKEFKSLIDQTHYQFAIDGYIERITIRNIMIATTNEELFLKDLTGNRRFYPIEMIHDNAKPNPVFSLTIDYIEQLWAEALYRYNKGERWNDNKREMEILARAVQRDRVMGYYGREEILEITSRECPNYGNQISYYRIRECLANDYGFGNESIDQAIYKLSHNLDDIGFTRCKSPIREKSKDGKTISSRGIYREYPI